MSIIGDHLRDDCMRGMYEKSDVTPTKGEVKMKSKLKGLSIQVDGAAGSGKSTLIAEIVAALPHRKFIVLRGGEITPEAIADAVLNHPDSILIIES